MNNGVAILFSTLAFYCLFSFDASEIQAFNVIIFGNNLSIENVSGWFFSEIESELWLLFIGNIGYRYTSNPLIRDFFMALIIDSVLSLIRFGVLGYYEPEFISPLFHLIPIIYIGSRFIKQRSLSQSL